MGGYQCNSCWVPCEYRRCFLGLITDVTAVGSPSRAKNVCCVFWLPFELETWSRALKTLLRAINVKREFDYRYNSCQIPCQSRRCFLAFLAFLTNVNCFLWSESHFEIWKSLLSLRTLLGIMWWSRVVDCQCISCRVPSFSREESDFFHYFWSFLIKLGGFCCWGAILWDGNPLLSPEPYTPYSDIPEGRVLVGPRNSRFFNI